MDPKLRINVNSGNQYDLTSSSSTSAFTSFTSPSIRSGAAPSTSSGASSGMTRNLDQATRMAVELSNIPWVGSASGATLVKSLNRASLTSCGLSLHSPFKTSGLIELDKDAEKLLSPLLNGNDSTCPRGLSRDILRSLSDKKALAQVCGSTLDSTYFNAVFGDSTEFPASTVLEFERHLASRIGDSGRFGGVLDELVPAPTSVFKNSRRADGGFSSPSGSADGPPRPRGHDPPMFATIDERGAEGGVEEESFQPLFPEGGGDGEASSLRLSPGEARRFVQGAWTRLSSRYGSPQVGLTVLRRLLGVPSGAASAEEISECVRDISQARMAADELDIAAGPMASSLQKRAFISEVKSKLLLLIQSGLPLAFLRPASSPRSPGDEWEDGSAAYPIVLDGASARGGVCPRASRE